EPSKEEGVTSLWNGDGIAPDDSARGPLVFIIPDTHPREILMLTHKAPEETGEASERGEDFTEIPISGILEHSSTYEFDLETWNAPSNDVGSGTPRCAGPVGSAVRPNPPRWCPGVCG